MSARKHLLGIPSEVMALPISELGRILAGAMHDAESDDEDEAMRHAFERLQFEDAIEKAVRSGLLQPRAPGTCLPMRMATPTSVVTVTDLAQFLADIQCSVEIVSAEASPAPVADSAGDAPAWHLMASPEELCTAFGAFTGMTKDWFNNLSDKPKLKAARFRPGVGGRNNVEPLFYVYPVLQWLIDKRRKTGRPMQEATGWRMLRQHFPKVYEAYELNAPDPD